MFSDNQSSAESFWLHYDICWTMYWAQQPLYYSHMSWGFFWQLWFCAWIWDYQLSWWMRYFRCCWMW